MSAAYEEVDVESRAQLRAWLAANHAASPGIWLVTYKKLSGGPYVPYDDVVEEALCFGWVDSRTRRVDELRSALLLTPRKPKSRWSRSNKERIARLEPAGLLTPAGFAAVEVAQANGSWTALDDVENLIESDDLRTALDARPEARVHWDGFSASARRTILLWILDAKRPQTRARRVEETVSEASDGRRAHH